MEVLGARNEPDRIDRRAADRDQLRRPGMDIDPTGLAREAIYKLLTGAVVPRPIAWVTTVSPAGVVNAAPFSAFAIVSVMPPMLLISCARPTGVQNDTARNIEATGCFCVNVVTEAMLETMHATSAHYPPQVSETEALGIAVAPCHAIGAPRIAAAPINMECRLRHVHEFGAERSQSFVGEVVRFHIAASVYDNGRFDQTRLKPVGRIGGPIYARLGELVKLRPPRVVV
jgi:flavin reductase (DIM6/NTAB) family NADH-FMN oxidoreductase RutF